MLSTVDLLKFSRFSGKATLFKMGSAKTIIYSNGVLREIVSHSLPAGILTDSPPEITEISLNFGDKAVMITDGIPEKITPVISELLMSKSISAEFAAKKITEEAELHPDKDTLPDDKTVVFINFLENL
jgi:serine phosphatase RsbU (regulator of sigma subunit)